MNRAEMLNRARTREKIWDFVIIGGGATGIGCAVDAASRGFSVLLLERNDFGKGTSSRSTKLVHGGVRYLAQGNLSLVHEALQEREILLKNAPHLVRRQSFIVPVYNIFDKFFYGAGLKTYDILSGNSDFGKSRILSKAETISRLPNVKIKNLKGGILYSDGQFDDARLLIDLAQTAVEQGAAIVNYAEVFGFVKDRGSIKGVKFKDLETGEKFTVKAEAVINATGAFGDSVRKMSDENAPTIIKPSQGIHLVFDKKFLASENALMIPKTSDGRVLFAIPWREHALFGTTDTEVPSAESEPKAQDEEIEFILKTANNYLQNPPARKDVLSVFAGVRPLVKSAKAKSASKVSRDHTIEIDKSNLLTITGGKWTTYRRMAEDAVNLAIKRNNLEKRKCVTKNLKIHETLQDFSAINFNEDLIVSAIRDEMARSVEDVLARRMRTLFLDAKLAVEIAPRVAETMASELGRDKIWIAEQIENFNQTAKNYFAE